ncbi:putative bifunctional diguanylate cyclase/phosphodiesterase [Nodosilinea nodulosa]|uniref:putative bifunctional diguanylate cyclase/phosphodiesterase n=1 Tax=Nodosilinea nodulosa TaxID=416001 RepID=UPI000307F4E2|nr:EAL domain-containing protein [Nodosilinea nodulosa]
MVHFRIWPFGQKFNQWVSFFSKPINFGSRAVLVSSLLALAMVSAGKRLQLFETLEMSSFDLLTRLQTQGSPDSRLLLVEVTEADLEAYGWPLSDQVVANIIAEVQRYKPAVVGLDLYRNTPQDMPGQAALAQAFTAPNVIGIFNVGEQGDGIEVPAPATWPPDQTGFNDLAIDPDGVLRRSLLYVSDPENPFYSFPLRVVLAYHSDLAFQVDRQDDLLRIGKAEFPALMAADGGYVNIDNRGYQVLMKYRTPYQPAPSLTITQVLAGAVPPDWVRGKIVLIGSTASSLKDEFFTPFSQDQSSQFVMSGVEVHAQSISQMLDAIAGQPALYRFLPQWGEFLWLLGWTLLAGVVGWTVRRPTILLMLSGATVVGIWGLSSLALAQLVWVPTVEPVAAFLLAMGLVLTQKALYRSSYDQLTLLPGRDIFLLQVQRALQHYPGTAITVVFLDIDRFKLINQSFGHLMGDRVLQTIGQRLRQFLPPSAQLARVGGDEFAFLLPVHDQPSVDQWLSRLQTELSIPFSIARRRLSVTSSMGVAMAHRDHPPTAQDLLRDAHTAMYRAKALHEYRHEVFASTMHEEAVRRLELESHLLNAFENNEFLLHFQPIVCLQSGRIAGFEALVRWYRPEEGFVSPGQFIQVTEETGLIVHLGQWIFRAACTQLKAWQQQFPDQPLTMSINLSRRQFHQADLVDQFGDTLRELALVGSRVQLEITESMIMRDVDGAVDLMHRLKQLGLKLAIDDFGTGYSSLSYLHRFPTDTLKIDQSFVGRMDESDDDREIVQTIVTLGHNLGMDLVAEGIETQNQLNRLRAMGCRRGQGYLFSQPLGREAATALLANPSPWPGRSMPGEAQKA